MGPTATGKSELGVKLALDLGCEIVSVDSAMVYRGMDIGTAKPSLADRCGIPHHLIDILDQAESFSTGRFRREALILIDQIRDRGKIPLFVGGTMLYFRALQHGLAALPAANNEIRQKIDGEAQILGWSVMHNRLSEIDPSAARRIHRNDPQRIQRALEIYLVSGKSLSDHCAEASQEDAAFRWLNLVLKPNSRSELHGHIESRFIKMLDDGMIDEVQMMIKRGDLNDGNPSVRAVGYRQIWMYLHGIIDRTEMEKRGIIATRQLAKRQLTWLRKESSPYVYRSGGANLQKFILEDLEPFLR